MFPLLRRITLGVALALTLAALIMGSLVRGTRNREGRVLARHAAGMGPRFIARELQRTPPAERERRIAEMARDFEMPVRLEPVTDRSAPMMEPRFSGSQMSAARPGPPPAVVIRLDDAWQVAVGPPPRMRETRDRMPPPPPGEGRQLFERVTVSGLVAFFVFASLVITLLVALPLARRMRAIERAVEELSRGNFNARVEGDRDDALGPIATALDRSAERLKRLFAERVELLQAVSHEIGTPLSRMRFHLEILEHATDGAQREKHLRAIDGEIRELDEMSSELVHWMEADAAELPLRDIPLRACLEELVELERAASPRDIPATLDVPDALVARAEPRLFARAIENLVRNALRYARERVVVSARIEAGRLEVSVRDDGPGIPEASRERVFQPFVRLDRSRSRAEGGAGLGLAIARRIVERHGGTIEIRQAPEGGAELRTRWPLTPAG
jgi:two-component system sensor histidine kinase RstB